MSESIGIDSNLGVERCREHILQISADASLRALKAALRGVRRRNTGSASQYSDQMGKVLSRHGELRREAARREHVAVGGARGLSAHAGCGPAGFDAG
jgi:hypothetical protein